MVEIGGRMCGVRLKAEAFCYIRDARIASAIYKSSVLSPRGSIP
jgi:hypothetical protein